jgi:transcriptional regulator with XRE-family HTH domain
MTFSRGQKLSEQKSQIKKFCDARGIKYRWIAGQLGMSEGHFNHIEAGRRTPREGYYEDAARILGVPIDSLRPEPEPVAATA